MVRRTAGGPTGTIMAPPMSCTTRATTSSVRPSAAAHSAEATVHTAIAQAKTRRPPQRSAAQPLTGRNAARATG